MVYRSLFLPSFEEISKLEKLSKKKTKCVDNVVSPIYQSSTYSRIVCPSDWSFDWMILNLEEYERKQKKMNIEREREEFKNMRLRSKISYILRFAFESEN